MLPQLQKLQTHLNLTMRYEICSRTDFAPHNIPPMVISDSSFANGIATVIGMPR